MIIRDRSFPHPVLAPFRDDVSPNRFDFRAEVSSDADSFYIDIEFDYDNASLTTLIDSEKAIHSVHFECKRNFYREVFSFRDRRARISISSQHLVGRVEVSGFVQARAANTSYRIDGSHEDYGDTPFSVEEGDVLAVATTVFFDAYLDYDPLRQVLSILKVEKSEDASRTAFSIDTSGNLIVVTLSQADFDQYTDLKADPHLGPLLANQLVVPALLEVLHEMKSIPEEDWEEEMDKRWFRSIAKKLEDYGIDLRASGTSVVGALQALLRLPLRRSLDGIVKLSALDEAP